MALKIKTGVKKRALKLLIYGVEGVGKTSLASNAPDVLFIDTEGGTSQMDLKRIDDLRSWDELLETVKEVISTPDVCKTLVIDTADWAEAMCSKAVCNRYKKTGIEEFGYGKGYTYLAEEFQKLMTLLDQLIDNNINVIVTAHAHLKKFEQPDEMGAYDRWELKLTKQVAPILKEWADIVLFLNYKTYVVTSENNTKKAQGGRRVMFANHSPVFDAKNRHGLPDEMDLDYKYLAPIFESNSFEPKESLQDILKKMLDESSFSESDLQEVVSKKGHYSAETPASEYSDEFISKWIIPHWEKINNLILESKNN